jgi:hypothetical protein
MVNCYVITSNSVVGDKCTIIGTVDGFPVTIDVSKALMDAQPSVAALRNIIAPIMLAQAVGKGLIPPDTSVSDAPVTSAGTFTQ